MKIQSHITISERCGSILSLLTVNSKEKRAGECQGESKEALDQIILVDDLGGKPVQVERGLFQKRQPLSSTLLAEKGQLWLAAMSRSDWSSLWMSTEMPRADLEHPELVLAKNKLQGMIAKVDNVDAVTYKELWSILSGFGEWLIGLYQSLLPWSALTRTGHVT